MLVVLFYKQMCACKQVLRMSGFVGWGVGILEEQGHPH